MTNDYKIFCSIILLGLISCGGGGVLSLSGGGGDGDGTFGSGDTDAEMRTDQLPGVSTGEILTDSYEVVIQLGKGVVVNDTYTDEGTYQLKSNLRFAD